MIGSTILIIASDMATRRFVGLKLKEAGAKVLLAPTAKEGLIIAWRDRPDGILIDPDLPDLDGLDLVRKLRHDRRTAHVPIVALSSRAQPDDILNGLEAGFDEYLVKSPAAVEQIIEVFATRLAAQVNQSAPAGSVIPTGRLILFASPKGGVGTSSLCANVAAMLAEQHPEWRIVAADLVLPIGSLASITGVPDKEVNIVRLTLMDANRLTTAFLHENLPHPDDWGFSLLPGSPTPDASSHLNASRLPPLFSTLQLAYDIVLVDIGRLISPRITTPLFQEANQVVLVMNTDPTTVSITRVYLDYLFSHGLSHERVFPIVNRTVGVQGLNRRELERELGLKLPATIPYMQENFSLANKLHVPISYKFPHYTATVALREATTEISRRVQS